MLEEALGYVTAALAAEPVGFEGKHYRLERFPLAPQPVGTVKIVVGGTGAHKTPYLAGTYADEYNIYPGSDLEQRIERAHRAAEDADRDPGALLLSSAGFILAAATQDELDEALDERASNSGMSRDELDEYHAHRNTPGRHLRRAPRAVRRNGAGRHHPLLLPGRSRSRDRSPDRRPFRVTGLPLAPC